ncbi:Dolichyl-diphosphooligosaccharide--glycosyltransferase subunit 2, partial [Paramuricea clavata]
GSIKLSFAGSPAEDKQQEKGGQFKRKPEIEHMFRQPEKRPPKTVSTAFTILALLPLLILFVAWLKLGVNLSNFQFSIPAIVFHVGLGVVLFFVGIFLLMYAFWTCLNMFSTLKLLGLVGSVTFLAGNSLLASLAAQRTKN